MVAAEKLTADTGTLWYIMVGVQIHAGAGGRGEGGGVKLAKSLDDVRSLSEQIIGMQLITPQTPPEGKKVNKVLIAEDVFITLEIQNPKNFIFRFYSTDLPEIT